MRAYLCAVLGIFQFSFAVHAASLDGLLNIVDEEIRSSSNGLVLNHAITTLKKRISETDNVSDLERILKFANLFSSEGYNSNSMTAYNLSPPDLERVEREVVLFAVRRMSELGLEPDQVYEKFEASGCKIRFNLGGLEQAVNGDKRLSVSQLLAGIARGSLSTSQFGFGPRSGWAITDGINNTYETFVESFDTASPEEILRLVSHMSVPRVRFRAARDAFLDLALGNDKLSADDFLKILKISQILLNEQEWKTTTGWFSKLSLADQELWADSKDNYERITRKHVAVFLKKNPTYAQIRTLSELTGIRSFQSWKVFKAKLRTAFGMSAASYCNRLLTK